MKKIFSLFTLLSLFVLGANAEEVIYALQEGDAFSSGQTVDVPNASGDVVATITYGESGGNDFKAAIAEGSVDGFTAYTAGNGTNGNKAGGTFYTIVPNFDGKIDVAVVLNADKKFHISEDGTDMAGYEGITVSEKYLGTFNINVKAGSVYKVWCDGSKLGFYGFKYNYSTGGSGAEMTDVLTWEGLGLDGSSSSYNNFEGKTFTSTAVYAGNASSGKGSYIQLRSSSNNAGIITTQSGGKLKSVTVEWNEKTTDRVLSFYGKNEAFSSAEDLYGDAAGDLLGEIAANAENKTLTVTGDYAFLGIRSQNGAQYINKITIVWEGGEAPSVAAPIINGESPFIAPTDVEITCATDGATIYYTTDGTNPTNASTEYTGVFSITESCVVKAIAYVGSNASPIASKSFVARTAVATVAELNALPNKTDFVFTGDAVATFVAGSYCYIQDNTGVSLIFGSTKVTTGQHLAPNWAGAVNIYNSLFEVVPAGDIVGEGASETIDYDEASLSDITLENANKVVKLIGVTVSGLEGKNFTLSKGGSEAAGYNNANVVLADGMTYNMIGAISRYKATPQFSPLALEKAGEAVAIEEYVASGEDLTAVINSIINNNNASTITLNLANDGNYVVSNIIFTDAALVIEGNGSTIDASAITGPFIRLSNISPKIGAPHHAAPEDLPADAKYLEEVTLKNLNIIGLKTQLVHSNKQKYLVGKVALENCDIFWEAVSAKKVFDFAGGGNIQELSVTNSTIGSANTNINAFFTTNSSQKMEQLGAKSQKISIVNSTFYNIANGRKLNDMRETGQAFQTYELKNSILVDCGKNGEFVTGLNGGQVSATSTWIVSGNSFNYTVEDELTDTGAKEVEKAGKKDDKDIVTGNVAGIVAFADPESGNFSLANCPQLHAKIGDPRWIDEDLEAIATELAKEVAIATELLGDTDPESFDEAYRLKIAITDAENLLESLSINSTTYQNTLDDLKAAEAKFIAAITPPEEPKYYIIGNAANGWKRTEIPEMVFNEETQAYEYELTITETDYFAIVDKVLTDEEDAADADWSDFNNNHRYALAEGNQDAKLGEEMQLVKVNGTLVLSEAGTYKLSMTKELKLTITQTTDIKAIVSANENDGAWYTIQGVRVAQPTKGVFIHNGKKVVIK